VLRPLSLGLRDGHFRARVNAVTALGNLPFDEVMGLLATALRDHDWYPFIHAAGVITRLTGADPRRRPGRPVGRRRPPSASRPAGT